ncbi:nucleotide-binding universal stress UspA family protein [Actinomycetospora cinnamomea]|uniref:Nucleotide-binding universal stress UspA family protein n=1 Tax=Actinomycetospora cinnamomea TaxID=663609 RepID=A0A2U1FDB9_9PSEU|nr:nucleotide-binding universal stress UspA family protein [Actinomycetospora cinnamomea]
MAGSVVLVGFDGSREAAGAIAVGARVLPGVTARVVTVWAPPGADQVLRRRITRDARTLDELSARIEQECAAAAEDVAADGAALARAAGWRGEPATHRGFGDAGAVLARLAGEIPAAALVVGSRGLGGTAALLGSVSDLAVHHSPVPVLVVPPLLRGERAAAATGPVLVGHDGSAGAEHAQRTASALLPGREQIAVHVTDDRRAGAEAAEPGPPDAVTVSARGWGARAIADALDAEAAARDAGVVVVGSRGRTALREVLLGSTAMAVLHRVHRPILVVPTPAER